MSSYTDEATESRGNHKRTLMVISAALTAILSLSIASPPAMAAESGSDSQYELTVAGQTTTLTEGATAVYPMLPVTRAGQASPDQVYPGDGTGTLTVTASGGYFHYDIAMHIPATNFIGAFTVTDLTSGQSGGRTVELIFAGDVATSRLRGHKYSGTLTGNALFAGVVVSTVGPNYTTYTYS